MDKRGWVEHNVCRFCQARAYHSCGWVSCLPAIETAETYYDEHKREIENEMGLRSINESLREAVDIPGSICVPLEEFDIEDLNLLALMALDNGVEIRIHKEESNFSQKVLVSLQRFEDRYIDPQSKKIRYLE